MRKFQRVANLGYQTKLATRFAFLYALNMEKEIAEKRNKLVAMFFFIFFMGAGIRGIASGMAALGEGKTGIIPVLMIGGGAVAVVGGLFSILLPLLKNKRPF